MRSCGRRLNHVNDGTPTLTFLNSLLPRPLSCMDSEGAWCSESMHRTVPNMNRCRCSKPEVNKISLLDVRYPPNRGSQARSCHQITRDRIGTLRSRPLNFDDPGCGTFVAFSGHVSLSNTGPGTCARRRNGAGPVLPRQPHARSVAGRHGVVFSCRPCMIR